MVYVTLALGLLLLFGGGELLVRGAVETARRLGVSPLVIGITLVGFGTSTPELVASIEAALAGAPAISIGNVIGSNIANVLLILGAGAVIRPMICTPDAFLRDGFVLVMATLVFITACTLGRIGWPVGGAFLLLLVVYTTAAYRIEKRREDAASMVHTAEAAAVEVRPGPLWRSLAIALAGMAAILLGANLLVDAAIQLARIFGISEAVIGLTVVALGTSLPELATAIVAAVRGQGDVAFGNVIGSNIFNLLGILGATALIVPIPVPREILTFDLGALLVVTILLVAAAVSGWMIDRREGAAFLVLYVGYVALLFSPTALAAVGMR